MSKLTELDRERVIQKRDLLEKMDAVAVPTVDRAMRTKGI